MSEPHTPEPNTPEPNTPIPNTPEPQASQQPAPKPTTPQSETPQPATPAPPTSAPTDTAPSDATPTPPAEQAADTSATAQPSQPTDSLAARARSVTDSLTSRFSDFVDGLTPPKSSLPDDYYTADGTPTFDAVAERIAQKSAAADGNDVLDAESPKGASAANDMEQLKAAGADRLAQIRKSMGLDK